MNSSIQMQCGRPCLSPRAAGRMQPVRTLLQSTFHQPEILCKNHSKIINPKFLFILLMYTIFRLVVILQPEIEGMEILKKNLPECIPCRSSHPASFRLQRPSAHSRISTRCTRRSFPELSRPFREAVPGRKNGVKVRNKKVGKFEFNFRKRKNRYRIFSIKVLNSKLKIQDTYFSSHFR